ncbi:MAG TPA: kynureninase [Bacteroidetes bacterium]|nr:kynureninase [Bacteroidota bacterium]
MTSYQYSADFAEKMDKEDTLSSFRDAFHIPVMHGKPCIYLTGNSLGLLPKSARSFVEQEFLDWQDLGVEGHTEAKNPWLYYHHFLSKQVAAIVGAKEKEVVVMNNLTVNLHLMLVSFYRPTPTRFKIIIEGGAFPSDQYAVDSQAKFHGFDPKEAIIELLPRQGEYSLRTEDILAKIQEHQDSLALVMLGGVNYYTGQVYAMESITRAAHQAGALCGFDLAHGAGNIPVKLHDWDVDFAVWCSYKYLNSGPGGTSGVFVHEKHGNSPDIPRFAGWWGHNEKERFLMKRDFVPMEGAQGWQLSNAQIFPMAIHRASLELFEKAGMDNLRKKSILLTGYLEFVLKHIHTLGKFDFEIITPSDPEQRGCQLSVLVRSNGKNLYDYLKTQGVIVDWREPNVIRMAPVPMYTNFQDIYALGKIIESYGN